MALRQRRARGDADASAAGGARSLGTSALVAVLGATSLLTARATAAESGSFQLAWSAPDECPRASFVEEEVARVVGRPWAELAASWRGARASVSPEGPGYRVRVTLVTPGAVERERSVLAASCTEATEAAVAILTAGMALSEPSPSARVVPLSTPEPPVQAPEAAAGDTGGSTAEPGGTQRTHVRPVLAASVGLDIGTLANVAPFAQLAGGVEWGRIAALGFAAATGRVLGELDGTAAGAQMSLLMAGALGCVWVSLANPRLAVCAGLEVGRLAANGVGSVDRRSGGAFWSASLARAALDYDISDSTALSVGATAVVPFRNLRVIARPDEVHRTSSVAVRPWIGLTLRFE